MPSFSNFDWHALVPYVLGLLLIFVLWRLRRLWNALTAYPAREEFALALNSQIHHTKSAEQLASDIETTYGQISIRMPQVKGRFRSAADMLTDLLFDLDVGTAAEGKFGRRQSARFVLGDEFGSQVVEETRAKLVDALRVLKDRDPFGSLSGTQANTLRTLQQAINSGDKNIANSSLSQIVEELASLNGSLAQQERANRTSLQVSVVSMVLTIVFGVASVILFFVQESAIHP